VTDKPNPRTRAGREQIKNDLEAARLKALRLIIPACATMTDTQLRLLISCVEMPDTRIEDAESLARAGAPAFYDFTREERHKETIIP
jgi:hypothetical protein